MRLRYGAVQPGRFADSLRVMHIRDIGGLSFLPTRWVVNRTSVPLGSPEAGSPLSQIRCREIQVLLRASVVGQGREVSSSVMMGADRPFEPLSRAVIDQNLAAARDLAEEHRVLPALIMGWAVLEAVGRALLPSRFPKAQTPGRLVDVLAAYGQLTPIEAERMRTLAQVRNRAVHGALQVSVRNEDLNYFFALISRMMKELPIDYEGSTDPDSAEHA